MTYFNEIAAVFGVTFLVLAFIGYWPAMLRMVRTGGWGQRPEPFIILAILIMDAKTLFRMFYWDIGQSVIVSFNGSLHGTIVNGTINTLAGVAGILFCHALLLEIPEDERADWTWYTAPFYPHRPSLECFLRIFRRRK